MQTCFPSLTRGSRATWPLSGLWSIRSTLKRSHTISCEPRQSTLHKRCWESGSNDYGILWLHHMTPSGNFWLDRTLNWPADAQLRTPVWRWYFGSVDSVDVLNQNLYVACYSQQEGHGLRESRNVHRTHSNPQKKFVLSFWAGMSFPR